MKRFISILFILSLLSTFSYGQTQVDTAKWTKILSAYGYTWNGGKFTKGLIPPSDTVNNKVEGSVALLSGIIYVKKVDKWEPIEASSSSVPDITLSDLSALRAYTGQSKVVAVSQVNRGGIFRIAASGTTGLTDNDGTIFHINDGRWAIRDTSQSSVVNGLWFGMVGDYNTTSGTGTDNRSALLSAIAATGVAPLTATNLPSKILFIPGGKYYVSDTIAIRQSVYIQGEAKSTTLYFASGKSGFIFNRFNTPAGQAGLVHSADGSTLENLGLIQKGPQIAGHAVIEHCVVSLINLRINDWGGCGVYINAGAVKVSQYAQVRNVLLNNAGINYTSVPTVTFNTPGTGATGTAVLGGSLISASLTDSGRGYYTTPTAQVGVGNGGVNEISVDTLGLGGKVTPSMGVDSIYMTNNGSGYTTATLTITGSTGPYVADPAICDVVVNEDGGIDAIDVVHSGSGYGAGSGTQVVISSETTGSGALAHAIVDGGGHISSVVVDDPGQDYTEASADVDITGGALVRPNAQATAIISGGAIIGAIITNRGRGYSASTDVHIAISGDGSGATATATLQLVGAIITGGGKGGLYESNQTVYFSGGRHNSGHDAMGIATVGSFKVKRVIINTVGNGYTKGSTVTFSGGGGTGALGTVVTFGERLGNANRWKCRNVAIDNCAYGLWTEGSDANAGLAELLTITNCKFYAVNERSFLGNSYFAIHTATNGGAYKSTSNTSYNTTFYNCYSEGGQLPSIGVYPAKLYGGDHGAKTYGTWDVPGGALSLLERSSVNTQSIRVGGDPTNGRILQFWNSSLTDSHKVGLYQDKSAGSVHFNNDDDGTTNRSFLITGLYTAEKFGRSVPLSNAMYIDKLRVGSSATSGRAITNSSAMPSTGEFAAGDFVIKSAPNTTDNIFGWIRLTSGSNHVSGTDWLELKSSPAGASPILNQTASFQVAQYKIQGDGSYIANYNGLTPLAIPHSGLDIITRGVDEYIAGLNIYEDNALSGLHLSSHTSNIGSIAVGGWQVSNGTFRPSNTSISMFRLSSGAFSWQNVIGATPHAETSLVALMTLDSLGRLGIGTTPTATLHLKASTTSAGTGPIKFTEGSDLTSTEKGVLNFASARLSFTPGADGSTRKRIPLTNDVAPSNGFIPIGNGTDLTLAALTQGTGISITNASGSITISSTATNDITTSSITSSSTPAPAGSTRICELYITALAANATVSAPSGLATNGNELVIRIKDNGTVRTLTWDAIYRASADLPLPGTTMINKTMYVKFKYNDADTKWDLVGVLSNF